MSITHLTSVSQLNGILSKSKDKLSVIDFHATWCGPCHAIAPTFEALAKRYTTVNFLKCDVEAARDVASAYSVSAMPTFIFLKGNTQIQTIRGADKAGLEDALRRHSSLSASTGAFSGEGQTLGGSSSSQPSATGRNVPGAVESVWSKLDPQAKVLLGLLAVYIFFWLV
ncbi:thioredoxin-domain-containing protein [Leucogyrophana mollusca]|uniref:Thioredoxin-domain-containing protein n=1 Tax=Leucogyrophana mollusca TaxID=85980 RepID=A0ACB8C0R7_9AGAM|nr:thioredoxin-domain-containing protein [Leucogyrophana mollusca]